MRPSPSTNDYDGWVRLLASNSHRQRAKQHLRFAGPSALPAIRRGLRHANAMVRRTCVNLLDQLVDDDSVPDLVAALDDPDTSVRLRALHALSCEPCKQNSCRPGDDLYVPRALDLVRNDPDPDVRAAAVGALGRVAERRADVTAVLLETREHDPNAGVRNIARQRTKHV
jgi:HEAT repeat protein